MTRYLTPSTVALLALITVYTDAEGVVPSAAVVPVLSFLASHVLPPEPSASSTSSSSVAEGSAAEREEEERSDHVIPIREFKRALATLQSSIPGRTLWDLFLKRIWALDCFDALDAFLTDLSGILVKTREERIRDRDNGVVEEQQETTPTRLARESPLGAFVRRAQLEYTRIRFDGAVQLWRSFIRYRMPTYHAWAKRNPGEAQVTVDANLVDLGLDMSSDLSQVVYGDATEDVDTKMGMSSKDIERLLEFQVGEMQCKSSLSYDLFTHIIHVRCHPGTKSDMFAARGCRVTDGMKAKLERMIASGAMVSAQSHYVK